MLAVWRHVALGGPPITSILLPSLQQQQQRTAAVLVSNHSLMVPGLKPVLQHLCTLEGLAKVVPAQCGSTKGRSDRLEVKVMGATDRGWRLFARKGNMKQDVFVVTALSKEELDDLVQASIRKRA